MPLRRLILPFLLLTSAVSCATFHPSQVQESITPLILQGREVCTAWSGAPGKWITAAHCTTAEEPLAFRDATRSTVLLRDVVQDLALLTGPVAPALRLASAHPRLGDPLYVYGYGMGKGVLILLPGVYIHPGSTFFDSPAGVEEMLIGGANGMPGMSGGPILSKGRVVSVMTGGGTAPSPTHLIGTGVPLRVLREFIHTALRK